MDRRRTRTLELCKLCVNQGRGVPDCTYSQRLDIISVIYLPGCRHTCLKTSALPLCCTGYWGPDCNGHHQ